MTNKTPSNTLRVSQRMQSALAELLREQTRDPRLADIVISNLEMSADMSTARISYLCPADTVAAVEEGLESANGFLRSTLAKRLAFRRMPALHFVSDRKSRYIDEIEDLLAENNPQNPQDDEPSNRRDGRNGEHGEDQ